MTSPIKGPTIGVFDSGFGGLTVLRALLPLIPGAHYHYLGDTARLPYGEKSSATVARYALSSAAFLLTQGIELLVVACNTATALALPELESTLPIPVLGVIHPGTLAAARANAELSAQSSTLTGDSPQNSPQVLVLATSATVESGAYTRACAALGLDAYEKACPLLVPLVEEGWTGNDPATAAVTREVLRIYLAEALAEAPTVRTLLLGCTHYPLLKPLIEGTLLTLNHPLHLIDSAAATAEAVAALLPASNSQTPPRTTFYATDSIQKFKRLGSTFLGQSLPHVHLVDLGG